MLRWADDLSRLVLDCSAVGLIQYRSPIPPVLAGLHTAADVQTNVGFYISALRLKGP